MEIVTGSTGVKHVTPIDDAVRNGNMGYFTDKVVFDVFQKFNAVARTANEVRVYGGYGMNQGRIFKIDENEFDSVVIESIENTAMKRKDLICARYSWNANAGTENISLAVIKGDEGADYVTPEHFTGDINSGNSDTIDDFPLYAVYIDGIRIDHIEALFTPLPDGGRLGALQTAFDNHVGNETNPHRISWTIHNSLVNLVVSDNLAVTFGKIAKAVSSLISHIGNKQNPHEVGGSQLTSVVPISKGGTGATTAQQALINLGVPSNVANAASKSYVDNAVESVSNDVQNLGENFLRSTYFINILDRPFIDFCQATTQIVGETKLSIRGNNNAYTVTLTKGDGTTSTLPVNDMDIDDDFMNKIKNSYGMELTMNDGQIIRTYKGNSKTPILLVDSSNKLGYYTFIFRKISNYDIDLILTAPTVITSGFSASQIFGISRISLIEDNFLQD